MIHIIDLASLTLLVAAIFYALPAFLRFARGGADPPPKGSWIMLLASALLALAGTVR